MYVRPPSVPHEWGELSLVCAHPQLVPLRCGLLCPCHWAWGRFGHQLTVRTWAQLPERSEAAGAGEDLAVGPFIPAEGITRQRRPAQDPTGPGWPGVLTEGSEPLPLQPSRGLSLSRSHPDPFCPNTHQRHSRWPGHRRSFRRGLAAEVVRTRLGAQLSPFQVGRPARPLVLPRDPFLLIYSPSVNFPSGRLPWRYFHVALTLPGPPSLPPSHTSRGSRHLLRQL